MPQVTSTYSEMSLSKPEGIEYEKPEGGYLRGFLIDEVERHKPLSASSD